MIRWIGAAIILAASVGFCYCLTLTYAREEAALKDILRILEFMASELNSRLTPLPQLCGQASKLGKGDVFNVFYHAFGYLQSQTFPDAAACLEKAVNEVQALPQLAKRNLLHLGQNLGRFDLDGQLAGLETVRQICLRDLQGLENNKRENLCSYQTLGFSAGAALVILLI